MYANPREQVCPGRDVDAVAVHADRARAVQAARTSGTQAHDLGVLQDLDHILTSPVDEVFAAIVEAAAKGATVGELCRTFRHDADPHLQVEPIVPWRAGEMFETLRLAVMAKAAADAGAATVFCANLGDVARYMPRLDFTRRFFQAGGFKLLADRFFAGPDDVAAAARESGARSAVIVGLDTTYAEQGAATAVALKAAGIETVILAGLPTDLVAALEGRGRRRVHPRALGRPRGPQRAGAEQGGLAVSRIPDFTKVDLGAPRRGDDAVWQAEARAAAGADPAAVRWRTNEQIDVAPLYTAADLAGCEHVAYTAGLPPFLRGPYATMYIVRPWTVRQYAGLLDRRGEQRLLPAQPRGRPEGPVGRLRPRDPPRLRQRPPARRRRRRQGRRGDRLDPRHEDPLRRHPPGRDVGVDDHERRGAAGARLLHRGRPRAGRHARPAPGDHPERHPQGVHGPQHLHLPARLLDADHRRHLRLHLAAHAEVQQHLDLGLPHAGGRGDGRSRAGLHHRRRARVRAHRPRVGPGHRRLRAAPQLLLGRGPELLHGDGQAARRPRAVGQAAQAVPASQRQVARPAHPFADQRLVARRAGSLQQRHPHLRRGDGRGAGPHPVAAHQRPRRGDRPADRLLGPHRPQHAALPAGRDQDLQRGRPLGRQLLSGEPDRRADEEGVGAHPGSGGDGRHGEGHHQRPAQAAHRGGVGPPPGAHRQRAGHHRRGEQVPARQGRPPGDPRRRQRRGAPAADRAAGTAQARPRRRGGGRGPRGAHPQRRDGRGQPARAVDRGGAGAGHASARSARRSRRWSGGTRRR